MAKCEFGEGGRDFSLKNTAIIQKCAPLHSQTRQLLKKIKKIKKRRGGETTGAMPGDAQGSSEGPGMLEGGSRHTGELRGPPGGSRSGLGGPRTPPERFGRPPDAPGAVWEAPGAPRSGLGGPRSPPVCREPPSSLPGSP